MVSRVFTNRPLVVYRKRVLSIDLSDVVLYSDDSPENLFTIVRFNETTDVDDRGKVASTVVLKVLIGTSVEHEAGEGVGPVEAIDVALKKTLRDFFDWQKVLLLLKYEVESQEGVNSIIRVYITFRFNGEEDEWVTMGESGNIVWASMLAVYDAYRYALLKTNK